MWQTGQQTGQLRCCRYGRMHNFFVACSTNEALLECMSLGMPCYNISMLASKSPLAAPIQASAAGAPFRSQQYNVITFQKVLLGYELLM